MQSMHYAVGKAGELVCEEILDLNREQRVQLVLANILLLVTQIRVQFLQLLQQTLSKILFT